MASSSSHTLSVKRLALACLCAAVAALPSGCAKSSPDAALDRLARRGFAFSIAEFQRAAKAGDTEAVEDFLQAGMAVNVADASGLTALGAACSGDAAETARVLLDHGAPANATAGNGSSPLMLAAATGSAPLVRLLLEHGADARAKDPEGWHPLALAAWNGRADAAAPLAAAAPAEELDDALLLATLQGNVEMTDLLLRRGASVQAKDAEGRTPLMIAASHGHAAVVKRLLENGANRFALHETSGRTAAQFAAQGEAEAQAKGDSAKAGQCRAVADALSAPPSENGDPSGVFDDPREVVTVPADGPDESTAAAIADGHVRLAQPLAKATLPVPKPGFAGLDAGWKMKEYREHPAPVVLAGVEANGTSARFRHLFGNQQTVQAATGQSIPGTRWKLLSITRKTGKLKDDGAPVDLSSVTIEVRPGTPPRVLVAGTQGTLDEPVAVLTARSGPQILTACRGDTFKLDGDPASYRVEDIGPDSVVVENLDTRESHTMFRR